MNVEEILLNLGYVLTPDSKGWRSSALYREGVNTSSLLIYKNGNWTDFVQGSGGNLAQLVKITLNLPDLNHAKQWLETKSVITETEKPEPTLSEPTIFSTEILKNIKSDHSYWLNRGISKEVLDELGGGIADIPKMKGRYVFTIWNSKKQIIGIQGRSLDGKNPRYKILGSKSEFCFPLHINLKDIKQKSEIILVEGVGCLLSLMVTGIRTGMVLFGTSLSNHQLSTIIAINPKKILICLNNDGAAGNSGAEKLEKRLLKFFDKHQVEIKLPVLKDFNEMILSEDGKESIIKWHKS